MGLVEDVANTPKRNWWMTANLAFGRMHVRHVEAELKAAAELRDNPDVPAKLREAANAVIDAGWANLISRVRMVGMIVEGRQA